MRGFSVTKKSVEANNQRIVQAVQRIAKTAIEEDGRLSAAAKKAAIGKTRGVGFYNSNGDIESSSGKLPDEAAVLTPNNDDSEAKTRNYKKITDDLEEGDKADEFEGYDCATGDKIQVDLAPMPGQEYQTPTGWQDANTPPVDPDYEPGVFWVLSFSGLSHPASTPEGSFELFMSANPNRVSYGRVNKTSWRYKQSAELPDWMIDTYTVSSVSCDVAHDSESYCNPSPEDIFLETDWPSDDITSLAVIDGKFQANQYDPDAADGYKNNPPSRIEMCDGLGNRYELNALESGNTMITKLQADGSVDVLGQSVIVNTSGVVKEKVSNYTRDGLL
jgi:hypothetical protein